MKKDVQGIILLLVGVMVLRLAAGDQFLFYVAEGMRLWLILAGGALVVFGSYALWEAWRESRTPQGADTVARHDADHAAGDIVVIDDDGHDHSRGPRIAYLLLLPVLAVYVVAPSALGSFSAARQSATSTAPPLDLNMPALSAADTADLPLRDYVVRAVWDGGQTLQGRQVTMTGFVTPDPDGGWWLTRMSMACCAADAQASRIKVLGAPELAADSWVTVTGSWVEGGGLNDPQAIPLLRPSSIVPTQAPRNPYE